MELGALVAALALGFRHGIDWDHIAAISDLTSSADSRRRGFTLSMVYAVGHAVVVFALGAGVIAFGASLPVAADAWLGRLVGLTLVGLGVWLMVELARHGRDFRLRSRWMLVLDGTFAGLRRVRTARTSRTISVEHDHGHEHVEGSHADRQAHDHDHVPADVPVDAPGLETVPVGRGATSRPSWFAGGTSSQRHRHAHRHDLQLPDRPLARYGNGTAAGVGMVHGVGVESPTQIALFVAASSATGVAGGLVLLSGWVIGLVTANAVLAVGIGYGVLHAERNFMLYATVAVLAAVFSVALGLSLVLGVGGLPDLAA